MANSCRLLEPRVNRTRAARCFLYASGVWRHLYVNFFLSLASAFLVLKDLHRKRFEGRLTQLQPLIIVGKRTERDALAAACAAAFPVARSVNSLSRNIFNGLLLVPVNEKIAPLNSIKWTPLLNHKNCRFFNNLRNLLALSGLKARSPCFAPDEELFNQTSGGK